MNEREQEFMQSVDAGLETIVERLDKIILTLRPVTCGECQWWRPPQEITGLYGMCNNSALACVFEITAAGGCSLGKRKAPTP